MRIARIAFLGTVLITACAPVAITTPISTSAQPLLPSPTPGTPLPKPQKIEFEAEDHTQLAGFYYPAATPNAPVIVLMHMARGSHKDWESAGLVQWLLNQGIDNPHLNFYPPLPKGRSFAIFSFDIRGNGESNGYMIFPDLILDARGAYEQAAKLPGVDPSRIAGIGASVGADGVVDVCTTCLGALTLSPRSFINSTKNLYKNVVDRLDTQGIIVWCLAGKTDTLSAETCASAQGKNYKSFIYEGNHHGTGMLSPDDAPEGVGQVVYDWLMETFK